MTKSYFVIVIAFVILPTVTACSGNESGESETNLEESFSGSLSSSDLDFDGYYYDVYDLPKVTEGSTIYASVNPDGFDAVLALYSDNELIQTEDEGYEGSTESFSVVVPYSSDYEIYVLSYNTGETGSYTLDYQVSDDDSGDDGDSNESDEEDSDSSSSSSSSNDDDECSWDSDCGSCESCRDGQCYYSPYSSLDGSCL